LKIVEESAENGMEMWTASVTMKKKLVLCSETKQNMMD
jgi:hypothetical protein